MWDTVFAEPQRLLNAVMLVTGLGGGRESARLLTLTYEHVYL